MVILVGEIVDINGFVPIKFFETYGINKRGDILDFRSKRLVKQYPNIMAGNYLQCQLINETGHVSKRVHRLVADCFLPLVDGKDQVDHIDRNRHNNSVENLRWVDIYEQSENKNVWEKSKTQKKYIVLENVKTDRNPNPSWRITIKNSKCNYKKRFQYATHTIEDIVKIRNEVLNAHGIPIID
jgi:hypothetical protein